MTTIWNAPDRSRREAVILVQGTTHPALWDPATSALVEGIEERMDGAIVTFVGSDGRPSLRDAVAAARFLGARRAVAVVPDRRAAVWWSRESRSVSMPMSMVVAEDWSPGGIVKALDSRARRRPGLRSGRVERAVQPDLEVSWKGLRFTDSPRGVGPQAVGRSSIEAESAGEAS